MKKYCECYQAGVSCTERCKCIDCANGKPAGDDEGVGAPAAAGDLDDVAAAVELAALSPSAYTSLMVPLKAPFALQAPHKPAHSIGSAADEAAARETAALALLAVSPLRNGFAPLSNPELTSMQPTPLPHFAAKGPSAPSPACAPYGKPESSLIGEMLRGISSPLKTDTA